ncbi:tRNA lysidine(34) synthetase TilS [Nocardioides lianchengensis]|uniref:tRNA(Ile)-lysidine synthase n=1 Tax=Nocardioides lianchengensis TaxID=1045774 RepID=A0A1G6PJH0_9ACTN|nr:tRNA lysidine(34) synthetase TilS [Nocardioides lianchengensis]NYG11873.1 tRNA(Ile)-lysidine synthase [Nocardioides lianchengensis]SDC80208.1 tRNA(Ile)-lysidine synthase [Nocardioides lianchengensis]
MTLHPSLAAVRRGVRRSLADLDPGRTVLVACSGGADSLALLAATVVEGHRVGLRVVGATVDHGLQSGSAAHAVQVVDQMAGLGVDETVGARVQVDDAGIGPEAAARRARYAVLDEMARHFDAAAVLLGHTRDDQAETVLLGLARGSGGRSLAGMRRSFDVYRRPLLDVARADTVTACQVEGIRFWEDPHNRDPAYTRARVRHTVLPVLEEHLGPGVAATLARTADQLRSDMELLDDLAEAAHARLAGPDGTLPVAGLAAEPDAVRRRVLRLAALAAGAPAGELFHEHVLALDALVTDWHGQRWIDLPGHLRGRRDDGGVRVVRAEP